MKRKEFKRSQFDEHESWEEQEAAKKTSFHGDKDKVNRANTGSSLLQQIRNRNRAKIAENGIGYSKDPEKRTK